MQIPALRIMVGLLYGCPQYLQYFYASKVLNSRVNTGEVVVVHLQHPQAGQRNKSIIVKYGELVVAQIPDKMQRNGLQIAMFQN